MAFTCSAEGTVDAAVFVCAAAAAAAISKKASDKHGNRLMALLPRTVIVLWAECLSGNCELCDPRGSHHCPASSIIADLRVPDCAACAFFCEGARSRPRDSSAAAFAVFHQHAGNVSQHCGMNLYRHSPTLHHGVAACDAPGFFSRCSIDDGNSPDAVVIEEGPGQRVLA